MSEAALPWVPLDKNLVKTIDVAEVAQPFNNFEQIANFGPYILAYTGYIYPYWFFTQAISCRLLYSYTITSWGHNQLRIDITFQKLMEC